MIRHRFASNRIAVVVLCAILLAAAAVQGKYIQPDKIDLKSILGTMPSADSQQNKDELKQLHDLQDQRTSAEAARCKEEENFSPWLFSNVMGGFFTKENIPVTAVFIADVDEDVEVITKDAKKTYDRPRPFLADPTIQPCVKLEKSYSYPSGHATHSQVMARILGALVPDKADQIEERAKEIGTDRELAGVHYPSDVVAGFKLGDAIADKLFADPTFKTDLAAAKAECQAHVRDR